MEGPGSGEAIVGRKDVSALVGRKEGWCGLDWCGLDWLCSLSKVRRINRPVLGSRASSAVWPGSRAQ